MIKIEKIRTYGQLLVVGEDWSMERHEYYGSVWFEFKIPYPNRPLKNYKQVVIRVD